MGLYKSALKTATAIVVGLYLLSYGAPKIYDAFMPKDTKKTVENATKTAEETAKDIGDVVYDMAKDLGITD